MQKTVVIIEIIIYVLRKSLYFSKFNQKNQIGISLLCTSKLRNMEKAEETKNLLVISLKITGDNLDMYIKTNH